MTYQPTFRTKAMTVRRDARAKLRALRQVRVQRKLAQVDADGATSFDPRASQTVAPPLDAWGDAAPVLPEAAPGATPPDSEAEAGENLFAAQDMDTPSLAEMAMQPDSDADVPVTMAPSDGGGAQAGSGQNPAVIARTDHALADDVTEEATAFDDWTADVTPQPVSGNPEARGFGPADPSAAPVPVAQSDAAVPADVPLAPEKARSDATAALPMSCEGPDAAEQQALAELAADLLPNDPADDSAVLPSPSEEMCSEADDRTMFAAEAPDDPISSSRLPAVAGSVFRSHRATARSGADTEQPAPCPAASNADLSTTEADALTCDDRAQATAASPESATDDPESSKTDVSDGHLYEAAQREEVQTATDIHLATHDMTVPVPTSRALGDIAGIGPGLVWMLNQAGIADLDDLATADEAALTLHLGPVGDILDVGHLIRVAASLGRRSQA